MTFWLTVIVLDYCESPSDEPGGKARRGPHTVSRRKLLAPLAASRRCEFSRRNALQSRLPTVRRRQRAGRLAPGGPLSRTAQPRKLGVQDGDGLGGGFPGCQAERDREPGTGTSVWVRSQKLADLAEPCKSLGAEGSNPPGAPAETGTQRSKGRPRL